MAETSTNAAPAKSDTRSLEHFLTLARRGNHSGASGGEKQAMRLATAIVNYSPGLDEQAIEGAVQFLQRAHLAPNAAMELLED